MAKPEQFTAKQMIDALRQTKGMITLAARQLGCASNTVRRYVREYPTVAEAWKEFHEQTGDAVELALYDEAINKRNTAALIFLAKTKYKGRGYTERLEHVILDVPVALQEELKRELEAAGIDQQTVFRELIDAAKARRALVGADGGGAGNDSTAGE